MVQGAQTVVVKNLHDQSAESGNPRLSVLLVNQHYAPSDAPTAQLLADVGEALAREGHNVTAISSSRGYRNAHIRYPKTENINGVVVRRVPGTAFAQRHRRGRVANYFSFFATAGFRLLRTPKADVVVSMSSPPLLATIVQSVALLRRMKMVYWVMDVYPELLFRLGQMKSRSVPGRIVNGVSRLPFSRADVVVVLGDDMALHTKPHSNGSTRVVANWADGDRIRPEPAKHHRLRDEWGWNEKFVVAYSGNMGLVHEFETIIEAAAMLEGDQRYLICFIGGGAREDEVRAEVKRRNLTNVQFHEFVPDDQLQDILTAPDLHLVSLRSDLAGLSTPSKTYAILAAGKPIAFVGPEGSDIAALVSKHACGVHVDNGDAATLADTIRGYGENAARVADHGTAARKAFDAAYTRTRGLKSMVSIITR